MSLKPCPFCGGECVVEHGVLTYAGCSKCFVNFSGSPGCVSDDDLAARWNTRAPLTPAQRLEVCRELIYATRREQKARPDLNWGEAMMSVMAELEAAAKSAPRMP